MPSRIVAGPHVICLINGTPYAQVMSAEWDSQTPKKPIYGIDSVEPFELAVTTSHVEGTLEMYRITGSGGLQGAGVIANFRDLPKEKYFILQFVDRRNDSILFECRQCSANSERWKIMSKALMTGSLRFVGIGWDNESTNR